MSRARRLSLGAMLTWSLLAISPFIHEAAHADSGAPDAHQIGRAEALFAAGKQRLAASDYTAACSLFAQSHLVDPATGSLLALALCHERQGKLASALREYEEALERSRSELRADREDAARTQIVRLRARVSTLTLRPEDPGLPLTVRVNGEVVPTEQIGRPQPIDGGFVLIEAEAEGKLTWRTRLTIAESGEALTAMIPLLDSHNASSAPPAQPVAPPPPRKAVAAAPAPLAAAPREVAASQQNPAGASTGRSRLSRLERTGIALLCAGALGAGAAVGFTLRAVAKNDESQGGCSDDSCSAAARRLRLQARGSGNIATVATAAAATLGTSGLIALVIGARRKRDARADLIASMRPSAWFDQRGAGGAVSGAF